MRKSHQANIQKTEQLIDDFSLNLQAKVTVKCSDGEFVFYPVMIPVILEKSLFNKRIDTVDLTDYTTEVIKSLFRIYMRRTTLHENIDKNYIELYRDLSDYLCVEFYTDYFNKLL